jgi:hypothetical protein
MFQTALLIAVIVAVAGIAPQVESPHGDRYTRVL